MRGDFFGVNSSEVSHAATSVFSGVAVEHFAPVSPMRNSHTISNAWHRSEVAHHEDCVLWRLALAQERYGTSGVIVRVDPFESRGTVIEDVHRGFVAIEAI